MKVIRHLPAEGSAWSITVELTRRNLEVLLAKLDDPDSKRTIIDGTDSVVVRAVENHEHYATREPGTMLVRGELI